MLNEAELIKHIESLVYMAGGQKAAARSMGISPQYLNDVLQGRRSPGPKLLQAIGYTKAETLYRRY